MRYGDSSDQTYQSKCGCTGMKFFFFFIQKGSIKILLNKELLEIYVCRNYRYSERFTVEIYHTLQDKIIRPT